MAQQKQKVVILGGGVASMASAWELTNQPDWQDRYDITLYQLGWRLGGKCASGRGPYDRIEEHGIHVLMGFYNNVFNILQSCYGELDRPPGAPLATWEEAVAKQDNVVLMEHLGERWVPWQFKFKTNNKVPGGQTRPHPHAVLHALLRQMLAIHLSSPLHRSPHTKAHRSLSNDAAHHLKLRDAIECFTAGVENNILTEAEKDCVLDNLEKFMQHLLDMPLVKHALGEDAPPAQSTAENGLSHLVHAAIAEAETLLKDVETHVLEPIVRDVRRAVIQLKMGYAMVRGIFKDGVLTAQGWNFAAINNLDLREWMGQNLAKLPGNHQETLNSAPVRGVYDLVFAYYDGVPGAIRPGSWHFAELHAAHRL